MLARDMSVADPEEQSGVYKDFSTRSTILFASLTASAIAATYAGLFGGTVDNFLAARIAATIAMTA